MNVQKVNIEQEKQDNYKSLLLLDEISKGEPLSQRDLSKKLNIALGLVNSYMKNLVSKGFITVKNIPAKRYTYYLTPKGFAEKTRLTYHLLQDYTRIYREARRDFKDLFSELHHKGIRSVVFAGVDEVAEIAYLSLQEVGVELGGVIDDLKAEKQFFKSVVLPYSSLRTFGPDCSVIITTYLRRNAVFDKLLENDVPRKNIYSIYTIART